MSGFVNQIKTVILLGILTAILFWIGSFWSNNGLLVALAVVLIMNVGSYWFSDKLVLAMYHARPVSRQHSPEIYKIVEEITKEAGIPMPKLYVIPTQTPNAFATGRNPKHAAVAVTDGIVKLLNKEELKAVIAHELGHVKNRDTLISTVAATIAGVIVYVARFAAIFGGSRDDRQGNALEFLVLVLLTPIVATLIQLAISRSREYLADESGAKFVKNPKALARALHKIHEGVKQMPLGFGNPTTASLFIVNPFKPQKLLNLFSTHPPVEERIRRLEAMRI